MDSQHHTDTNNDHTLKIGIDAAMAGNRLLARLNLEQVAAATPDNATCWLWLAWTADSPAAAITGLEQVLRIAPTHRVAQAGLDWIRQMQDFDMTADYETSIVEEPEAVQDESPSSVSQPDKDVHQTLVFSQDDPTQFDDEFSIANVFATVRRD